MDTGPADKKFVAMVELYPSPWRKVFESFLEGVSSDLLIASPYIKTAEAGWICNALASRPIHLRILTDMRSDSVLNGSLDIPALRLFARVANDAKIIAVSLAVCHALDVVVSWNMKHLVNVRKVQRINAVNLRYGLPAIRIHTPEEIVTP